MLIIANSSIIKYV